MGDGSAFGRERVAQYLRHDLGVTEIAHEPLLCISEREMSGACVADSFARAKGPEADRYIHPTPGGAQAAGCIYPAENVRARLRVVNPGPCRGFLTESRLDAQREPVRSPKRNCVVSGRRFAPGVNQTRRLAGHRVA